MFWSVYYMYAGTTLPFFFISFPNTNFLRNTHNGHPDISTVMAKYGISLVNANSDAYSIYIRGCCVMRNILLSWWRHQMETFSALLALCDGNPSVTGGFPVIKWKHFPRYWPFVRGIHRWPVDRPHKGQWRGALMFSLICAWTNGWANNRDAGDLRRYCAHYDVTVMILEGAMIRSDCNI